MKTEFIPKIITLLAGAVICIVCIVRGTYVTTALEYLLATLIVFYIVGCIVRRIIEHVIAGNSILKRKNKEIAEESEENVPVTENNEDKSDDNSEEDNQVNI